MQARNNPSQMWLPTVAVNPGDLFAQGEARSTSWFHHGEVLCRESPAKSKLVLVGTSTMCTKVTKRLCAISTISTTWNPEKQQRQLTLPSVFVWPSPLRMGVIGNTLFVSLRRLNPKSLHTKGEQADSYLDGDSYPDGESYLDGARYLDGASSHLGWIATHLCQSKAFGAIGSRGFS